MTSRVIVHFEGDGSGAGDLSWGQEEIWSVIRDKASSLPMGGVRALPAGQTVADVAAGLSFIVSRHQSPRTRLRFDPGGHTHIALDAFGQAALHDDSTAAMSGPGR